MIEGALDPPLLRRARRALAALGDEGMREGYWTTFWLPRGAPPSHALEEAVLALWAKARPGRACAGAEWWIGRSYTTAVPVGFHFDQDVKAPRGLRHPLLSSVLFLNRVRGGQLAVTDQRPGPRGEPVPHAPRRLQTIAPRPNRYATFPGALFHGVLDARGRTPGRPLPGPRGRMRRTLVVNYWVRRPAGVPRWGESRAYPSLRRGRRGPPRAGR